MFFSTVVRIYSKYSVVFLFLFQGHWLVRRRQRQRGGRGGQAGEVGTPRRGEHFES